MAEGRAAGALERRNLRNADPSDIQNIFLFNITADPYETTDLSLVCLIIIATLSFFYNSDATVNCILDERTQPVPKECSLFPKKQPVPKECGPFPKNAARSHQSDNMYINIRDIFDKMSKSS